ncbi:helix-hairpin-helix domain-containing protein [Caulobacter sp. 73W]|uniref:Helix-hairpin-helix domain-containing protein n=1 Tax=Caulobacter sp. 73W TaxID=3161137 RepID=A0AB39KUZ8_9CAUL
MASEFPKLSYDAERALHFPLGLASPLWLTFGGAAAAGAAWWWMTRWTQVSSLSAALEPTNLEAALAPQPAATEVVAETVEEATLQLGDVAVETGAPAPVVEAVVEPVIEAASETVEAATEIATEAADDFTRLVGVGPRLAQALVDRGVRNFAEIAAWTEEDLAAVDRDLDLKGRAVRDAWVAQAKRFAEVVEG